jgi:hypothetical protein
MSYVTPFNLINVIGMIKINHLNMPDCDYDDALDHVTVL